MIGASLLPHHFEPRAASVLAAVGGELPEKRIHQTEPSRSWDHVDDGYYIEALCSRRLLRETGSERDREYQGDKKSARDHAPHSILCARAGWPQRFPPRSDSYQLDCNY